MTNNEKLSIELARFTHTEGFHYDEETAKWLYDEEWLSDEDVIFIFKDEMKKTGRIYEFAG